MNRPDIPFHHVGVLMGGTSTEREVSLRSGTAVLEALQHAGIEAIGIDLQMDWPQQIKDANVDAVFIALHGTLGEDGCVQGLLEMMRIPYTGSGVLASALCMHKTQTLNVLKQAGLSVPVSIALSENGPSRYPVFLKPEAEGSSVGLHYLKSQQDWDDLKLSTVQGWMAEMPLKGPELAVSVLAGKALPPVEVVPKSGVYDYASKYTPGATEYFCPARIPPESLRYCMQQAEAAVRAVGACGAPRVDMILHDGGEPVMLEINTIPGMTQTSLLPKAAAASGIDFATLCLKILSQARCEHVKGVMA